MTTKKITVKGLVQGIGYRPFVAETAEACGIGGWVRNTDGIVTILASGAAENMERFLYKLKINKPVGAKVEELFCEEVAFQSFPSFQIIESEKLPEEKETEIPLIPADLPTCDRCLGELHDPGNRRYRHPFISCTSCGPRYSIIERLPYDRDTITMKKFPMCDACSREYVERGNVRRHAQTIACLDCGPMLQFVEIFCSKESAHREKSGNKKRSESVPEKFFAAEENGGGIWGEDAFRAAICCLQSGGIVAVKDIGGYHLACTPFVEETVSQLRLLKGREKKPFAVMFPDVETIKEYCEVSVEEEALLVSAPRPIVLLKKKKNAGRLTEKPCSRPLVEKVCGSSPDIGAMLPCNPLQTMLLEALGPLIMTSANASGEVLILENEKMVNWMTERAGVCKEIPENLAEQPSDDLLTGSRASVKESSVRLAVLGHDRPILTPLDDSIVRDVRGRTQIIRRARGFVPNPIRVGIEKKIFAAGGDLKASFCYTGGGKAYPSQYLGDLEETGCYRAYIKEKERMKTLFGFQPEYAVCDMHPGYLSAGVLADAFPECTEPKETANWVETWSHGESETFGIEKSKKQIHRVQHHEAHVASVIAEHGLKGSVLGYAFDGTGYGRDHTIWGSEVFFWDGLSMKRVAHLKPVRLIGGDEGARNADTILYGYMESFGEKTRNRFREMKHLLPYTDEQRSQIVQKAIQHNINTVTSTSMGRLFDAVSALLDICHYNGYEGEAAIGLENLAATTDQAYGLSIKVKTHGNDTADAMGSSEGLLGKSIIGERRISDERVLAERRPEAYNCEMEFQDGSEFCGDTESLFAAILDALEQGVPKAQIAQGFIRAVSDFIVEICRLVNESIKSDTSLKNHGQHNVHQIALSGGTFQNRILLEQTIKRLEEKGYQVYINEQVPCGDGGICLGQAYLCDKIIQRNEE
ncbi:MAG: carbamoyltransferase HypF [Roseburia sp.]|nr:carbamoyltransferase HypF [Roseburia sp.]